MPTDSVAFERDRDVIVVLQDGTQLEGLLVRYDQRLRIGDRSFCEWEIDDLFEVS